MKIERPDFPISIEIEDGHEALAIRAIAHIAEWAIRSGAIENMYQNGSPQNATRIMGADIEFTKILAKEIECGIFLK